MTQGLSDVCDPHFNPKRGDPHEQHFFTEKQNFVHAVVSKLVMAGLLSENMSMTRMLNRSCAPSTP